MLPNRFAGFSCRQCHNGKAWLQGDPGKVLELEEYRQADSLADMLSRAARATAQGCYGTAFAMQLCFQELWVDMLAGEP